MTGPGGRGMARRPVRRPGRRPGRREVYTSSFLLAAETTQEWRITRTKVVHFSKKGFPKHNPPPHRHLSKDRSGWARRNFHT